MMKKAVLQFTACCMAAGVSVASFSSVALADTSNALAGVDAAVVSEGEAEDAQETTQSETADSMAGAAGTEAAEGDAAYTVTSSEEVNGAYTFGYGVVTADEEEEEEAADDSGEEVTVETAGETLAGTSGAQVVEPAVDEDGTEEETDEETETESESETETDLAGVTLAINVDEDEDADEDGAEDAGTSSGQADAADDGEQAFAQCEDYINVRATADADGEAVGKLYNNNEVTILSKAGAWYKIQSGNVVGYVKAEYFATGEEAEKIAQTAAYTVATVKADDLLVRSAADKTAETVDMVNKNDKLDVISEDGDWVKVRLSDGTVGYVSAEYVDCNTCYSTGETLEEEQERLNDEWEDYLGEEDAAVQEVQATQAVYYDDEPSYSEFSYVDYTEPYYEEDYTDSYYTDAYYTDAYYTDEYYTDEYYTDGYYTDEYYTDEYYADGYYTDEYYTDGYYTDGYYTDEYYTDGYYTDEYYTEEYYTDGSYTDTYYTDTASYTDSGSVDAAYQNYLEKQAEADAACNQADEQLVYDTYNAAVAAYQEYLDTVAAADAASAGSYSYTEPSGTETYTEPSYTETYTESYTYVDSTSVDAAYQNYLEKQAEADAACLQADEQLVYDTYNAAVAAYQEYLDALNGQATVVTETTTVQDTVEETTQQTTQQTTQETTQQQISVEETYSEETTAEPVAETASSGSSGSSGSSIASYATQFVGNPYVYGGTSLTNGADCSGFTQSVFANFGISIPRTAAEQANSGTSVDLSDIQAGDLLFYSDGSGISHVSMYIGDGQVVHASTSSTGIIISSVDYRTPVSAKRYW